MQHKLPGTLSRTLCILLKTQTRKKLAAGSPSSWRSVSYSRRLLIVRGFAWHYSILHSVYWQIAAVFIYGNEHIYTSPPLTYLRWITPSHFHILLTTFDLLLLSFWTLSIVQKLSSNECYTPSSEPFRNIWLYWFFVFKQDVDYEWWAQAGLEVNVDKGTYGQYTYHN
jgi:hypothetical protein